MLRCGCVRIVINYAALISTKGGKKVIESDAMAGDLDGKHKCAVMLQKVRAVLLR